jgi:hypothetical protein
MVTGAWCSDGMVHGLNDGDGGMDEDAWRSDQWGGAWAG